MSTYASLGREVLPFLPLLLQSNVLAISWEWRNHLSPLTSLAHPIHHATLSEIFRRSYTHGASSFLFNLLGAIGSSAYLYYLHREPLDGWTAMFGVLHLFPFSTLALPYILRACDGRNELKHEDEVKQALASWLHVNRWRLWTDIGGTLCALAAVVQRARRA
jgi:hypothetical protein